jgi:hypothetical protein
VSLLLLFLPGDSTTPPTEAPDVDTPTRLTLDAHQAGNTLDAHQSGIELDP